MEDHTKKCTSFEGNIIELNYQLNSVLNIVDLSNTFLGVTVQLDSGEVVNLSPNDASEVAKSTLHSAYAKHADKLYGEEFTVSKQLAEKAFDGDQHACEMIVNKAELWLIEKERTIEATKQEFINNGEVPPPIIMGQAEKFDTICVNVNEGCIDFNSGCDSDSEIIYLFYDENDNYLKCQIGDHVFWPHPTSTNGDIFGEGYEELSAQYAKQMGDNYVVTEAEIERCKTNLEDAVRLLEFVGEKEATIKEFKEKYLHLKAENAVIDGVVDEKTVTQEDCIDPLSGY